MKNIVQELLPTLLAQNLHPKELRKGPSLFDRTNPGPENEIRKN
jgi:hypothetical protein